MMMRVKDIIEGMNISQTDLAARLDITVQRLNGYLTGRTRPDNAMLVKIADTLNVTADFLLGITENAIPYMSIGESSSLTYEQYPSSNPRLTLKVYESRNPQTGVTTVSEYTTAIVRMGTSESAQPGDLDSYFSVHRYAIIIKEDSMSPDFMLNDLIYMQSAGTRESGKIYALKMNGDDVPGVCLRKCTFKDHFIIASPLNEKYLPELIDLREITYDPVVAKPGHLYRERLLRR